MSKGVRHAFRYLNDVPLNDTHFELEVNFLEYWETRPNGGSSTSRGSPTCPSTTPT